MSNINEKFKSASSKIDNHLENSNDDKHLKKPQRIFDGIEFYMPVDYDTWNVQKQREWAQSVVNYFPNLPKNLQNLIPAGFRPIDHDRSQNELPEWLDIDKYQRGKKFVREHYVSIIISILFGAIYSYTFEDGLKPIIIGGNSHTPYLAFKRYINTIKRMFAWYNGEPWVKDSESYSDMQITRKKHKMIDEKISQINSKQYYSASKFADPWCPEYELLLKDFALTCPSGELKQRPYKIHDKSFKPITISNVTMAVAQANFIILPILYPQNIGIHNVTDEDLEAFCHMWKCYGYFLGLEDEYNVCRGSLEEIKQRLCDITQYWTLANFTDIEPEFVHVTRCIIEIINYYPSVYHPYKIIVLLFMEALNLNMPNLYASLSYTEWIIYKVYRFFLRHMLKFSRVRSFINRKVHKIIKTLLNLDQKKLAKLHKKSKQKVPDFLINL